MSDLFDYTRDVAEILMELCLVATVSNVDRLERQCCTADAD